VTDTLVDAEDCGGTGLVVALPAVGEPLSVHIPAVHREGSPGECVRGYLERSGADMLALGTHERRGPERFLRHALRDRVVPRVDQPVLSVRSGGDRAE